MVKDPISCKCPRPPKSCRQTWIFTWEAQLMFRMLKYWWRQNLLFYAQVYAVGRASNTQLLMLVLDLYTIIGWKTQRYFYGKHGISYQGYVEEKRKRNKLIFLYLKNQALQMLYLKHHVYKTSIIIMDKKLTSPQKFDPYKINKYTLQYKLLLTTQ